MEQPEKQDINTGKNDGQIPILASAEPNMEAESKVATTESESASIKTVAGLMALLQNDCSELQSAGLKIAILARSNKLYFVLEYKDHDLGFDTGTGHFLLDSVPVLKGMESETGRAANKRASTDTGNTGSGNGK